MTCIYCKCDRSVIKQGYYIRPSDQKRVQRFYCKTCRRKFSEQSFALDFRHRKRFINQGIFRALAKGNSQRSCAFLFNVSNQTIARRVRRFGRICAQNLENYRSTRIAAHQVMFDEMESFIHTKCKPVTIPIAVEAKTRKVLALGIGTIAAKGHLAAMARKKYGHRPCQRAQTLRQMMFDLKTCVRKDSLFLTDQSQHYPGPIARSFPQASHKTSKGRRGCVVGQGELKRGGWDPLFSLNHTYAMFRDNLKTLSRRTWCTAKRIDGLLNLLNIYAWFHNQWVDSRRKRRKIRLAAENFC